MIPKSKAVEVFCSAYHIRPSELVYFEDLKPQTRHCCLEYPGIVRLNLERRNIVIDGHQITVPFFLCQRCAKLLIYKEFI